ncbi:MAG TPA: sensor domain-containing diguanylate cyclase [Bacillota bacterium]|nr:sensor domain-containing diguanylate cyclase [Bacillota bacterium]
MGKNLGILSLVLYALAALLAILAFWMIFCEYKYRFNELNTNVTELKEENVKLNGDLNKAIFEIMALYEFTNILGVSVEYRNMLEQIIDAVQRIFNYDRCCLFIYDEDTNELFSRVQRGFPQEIESLKIPLEQFWYGKTLKTGQAILIDDLPREIFQGKLDTFRHLELLGDTKSFIAIPMTVQSKIIGILLIAKDTVAGFSHENLRLLFIIANEAALLIQNSRLYEQVYYSSITDGLTGVYNHKYFREQIELQVQQAKEYGFNISLALIDIDHFKSFNDTYGHQVGDIVLKEVARLIQETVPSDNLVARYGGEEFAVIMPDTQIDAAIALCENIRNKIANHFFRAEDKAMLKVTVSLGVACFPEHIKNLQRMVEELIDLADEYLYYSKDKGRNQVSSPVWKFV